MPCRAAHRQVATIVEGSRHENMGNVVGGYRCNRYGPHLEPVVPDQQETLDKFLRTLHRWAGTYLPGPVLLACGCKAAPRRLDQAHPRLRKERDCRVFPFRGGCRRSPHAQNSRRWARSDPAGVLLLSFPRPYRQPFQRVAALRAFLCGNLLVGDGRSLPERYLSKDLTRGCTCPTVQCPFGQSPWVTLSEGTGVVR